MLSNRFQRVQLTSSYQLYIIGLECTYQLHETYITHDKGNHSCAATKGALLYSLLLLLSQDLTVHVLEAGLEALRYAPHTGTLFSSMPNIVFVTDMPTKHRQSRRLMPQCSHVALSDTAMVHRAGMGS